VQNVTDQMISRTQRSGPAPFIASARLAKLLSLARRSGMGNEAVW